MSDNNQTPPKPPQPNRRSFLKQLAGYGAAGAVTGGLSGLAGGRFVSLAQNADPDKSSWPELPAHPTSNIAHSQIIEKLQQAHPDIPVARVVDDYLCLASEYKRDYQTVVEAHEKENKLHANRRTKRNVIGGWAIGTGVGGLGFAGIAAAAERTNRKVDAEAAAHVEAEEQRRAAGEEGPSGPQR